VSAKPVEVRAKERKRDRAACCFIHLSAAPYPIGSLPLSLSLSLSLSGRRLGSGRPLGSFRSIKFHDRERGEPTRCLNQLRRADGD